MRQVRPLIYQLLLVNGQGDATGVRVRIRTLREFPAARGLSVHFRPVRNDLLFESAKLGGSLAYRILSGEGIVRGQLWVEFEVLGEHLNVTGRSSDLLFALALITATWTKPEEARSIAATGVLSSEGAVQSVERTVEKVAAAVRDLRSSGTAVIFYPAADRADVESWRATTEIPAHVELCAVAHLEDALGHLGYGLEKVYLRNPFRGLEHFDFEHHAIFFGRDREVREVLKQLLRCENAGTPGVLVEGPSGSGKSSFLRAGVLPALVYPRAQPDTTRELLGRRPASLGSARAVWRPGLLPPAADELALVLSICDCWRAYPELPTGWEGDARTLAELARERRKHWPSTLRFVWTIDQFEEILAIGTDPLCVEALGTFLTHLQRDGVWTLVAVRSDAMAELKRSDTLRQVFGANEGQYYLAALSGAALDDVIALPTRAGDLTFDTDPEGKPLDQILREDAYREQDSLPLLQFTLNELYLRRSGSELTFAAYRQLGGLSGSIATAAEAVLRAEDTESQRTVARVFRSLVSVDEVGRASRRYALLAEIAPNPADKRLTLRLVEARLCVTDRREGEAVVAFAHDSLLRALPALTAWLRQEAGLLQTRELAQREARLWQQHGEADSWLATPDKLAMFETLEAAEIALPNPIRDFIQRSRQRVRRTIRIKRSAIGVIGLLAIAASAGAWIAARKQQEAEYQTAQTLAAQSRLLTETAAGRLREGDVGAAENIIIEVLTKRAGVAVDTAAALNVFQQARAVDSQVLAVAHVGRVRRAAYSPDGAQIVTADFDGTARIFDVATGRQLQLLSGHTGTVFSAAFSPDGKQIVTASQDRTARVWDAATGVQMLLLAGHTGRVTWAGFSPDGREILTASTDSTVRTWDARTGRQQQLLSGDGGSVSAAAYSPNSKQIATASVDGARIWDTTGRVVRLIKGHTAPVAGIAFSPDGKQIVTASHDKTVRTWDIATGRQLLLLSGHTDRLVFAEFSPDGKQIATSASDNTARIWDATTGQQLLQFNGHPDWVSSAAFSPDGKQIVSASVDRTTRIWDIDTSTARQVLLLKGHTAQVNFARFSASGKLIVSASNDRTAAIWDAATARQLLVLTGHEAVVNTAEFSPDGKRILTSSDDKTARVWDAATGAQVLLIGGHSERLPTAAFSPDGTQIVTSSDDKTARIWDAATGRQVRVLSGHTAAVNQSTFSPDGRQIVTISVDKSARIWDSVTGRQILMLSGHTASVYCVAFSPDGKRIVTGSHDYTARVWDAATGRQLLQLNGHTEEVRSVAFSPDGKRIITSGDNTVRIWDASTGQPLLLKKYSDPVWDAQFSPDGQRVVTSMSDKTMRVWDARAEPIDIQIEYATAAQFERLTRAERFQLGLPDSGDVKQSGPRQCAASAVPPPAPQEMSVDKLDPAVPYVAAAACAEGNHSAERSIYEHGREMLGSGNLSQARRLFEAAIAGGYRPAQIDLAMLLSRPSAALLDIPRAVSLYEQAWKDGLSLAGFELGDLYEHGVRSNGGASEYLLRPNEVQAWGWYRRAAEAGEPRALARLGERATDAAYAEADRTRRNAAMLESFRYYAAAAELARIEDWPDDAWRPWRYRRASLARLLEREGMMREVADMFDRVRKDYAPTPAPRAD